MSIKLRHRLERYFNGLWYETSGDHWLWSPLSKLYRKAAVKKRLTSSYGHALENYHNQQHHHYPPVLVVGNITVGGTGKTPLVIFLIEHLRAQGYSVGVLSRGYGGDSDRYPLLLDNDCSPQEAGDEPFMIFERTGVCLVVDPDRMRGLAKLAQHADLDVVISDDGLQHYKLPRQYEIAVIDGERGVGNGHCLPAGPLREPVSRLQTVDAIVVNGAPSDDLQQILKQQIAAAQAPEMAGEDSCRDSGPARLNMTLKPQTFIDLHGQPADLTAMATRFANDADRPIALCAIGNPQRFFSTLESLDIQADTHIFPDHHAFTPSDLEPFLGRALIMTEKDAIKIRRILPPQRRGDAYFLAINAELDEDLVGVIMARIRQGIH